MKKHEKNRRFSPIKAFAVLVLLCALAAAAFALKNAFDRETHPLKYTGLVETYAEQNKLDKYLVYAVIKTESGFDETAESDVGARGLMQIMENTYDWIKFKMENESSQSFDDMYKASYNIEYGAFLISSLYYEFSEDITTTMAAYHAGRGQVHEWLENTEYSADGQRLDTIPSKATAHYVDKILKAYETYKRLYKEEK